MNKQISEICLLAQSIPILGTSEAALCQYQIKLAKYISLEDRDLQNHPLIIAGVDLAYWEKDGRESAVCSIVVVDVSTGLIKEKVNSYGEINSEYKPGFLAFRELPLIIETAKKLTGNPDLFMFDGNGYLHPRHMGIASHASFYLQKPTIGVAKSYYKINETDYRMPCVEAGSYTDIVIKGEVYGRVLRTHTHVKPIFVSVGNWISIDTACSIVLDSISGDSRIPIPTRLADIECNRLKRQSLSGDAQTP